MVVILTTIRFYFYENIRYKRIGDEELLKEDVEKIIHIVNRLE